MSESKTIELITKKNASDCEKFWASHYNHISYNYVVDRPGVLEIDIGELKALLFDAWASARSLA
jgi:hypothetical protein